MLLANVALIQTAAIRMVLRIDRAALGEGDRRRERQEGEDPRASW